MILDVEDLQGHIVSYFETNLNTCIDALNLQKPDGYVIPNVSTYIWGEEQRGRDRKTVKYQLNVTRSTVDINNDSKGLTKSLETSFLVTVNHEDNFTESVYRKGLRFEQAVYNCSEGLSDDEQIDVRIVGMVNEPVNPEGTQGLRASGVLLNVVMK